MKKTTRPVQETADPSPSLVSRLLPADASPETVESMQRLLAEYTCDIELILDAKNTILYISPSVQKISGWTQKEIQQKPYIEWIHPEDRFRALQIFDSCRRGETRTSVEWRLLNNSGAYIWLETRINAIGSGNDILCRLVLSSRDITVRKNFEAELLKSEERFRSLIEKSPVGISIVRDGEFLFMSRAGLRFWGYDDLSELQGRHFEMVIAPSQRKKIVENYERRLKGDPIPGSYEILGIRKDGTEFPFRIDVAGIVLADGPASIYFYRDISEEKRAENALRESEERLMFALEGTRHGFFDWNIETDHVVYSGAYLNILGYDPEELNPHYETWESLLHPEDKSPALKILQDHLEGRTDFYISEHRLRTKSGNYLWVCARGRVMRRDPDGKPLRMNGTHHNISERKRLEEELRSSREDLEKLVMERTVELQEVNIAMRVLLKQRETEISEMEHSIIATISGSLQRHVNRLKGAGLNEHQMACMDTIEEDLRGIMIPFAKNLKARCPSLTATEIEIANYIRNGKNSKDVAEQLHISVRTVDLVRYRIRNKLQINNRNVHLETYLSAIQCGKN